MNYIGLMRSKDQQVCRPTASKHRGRRAHEYHSRVNCAWRSPLDKEADPDFGYKKVVGSHHLRCSEPGCNGIIRVIRNGWAVCENEHCRRIYNDMVADIEFEKIRHLIDMSRFIKKIKAPA